MMFQRDFGGVFHLFRRAAQHGRQTRSGHRRGAADFSLAAAFSAGDAGVVLAEAADGGGGEQEIADPGLRGAGDMVEVVAQHRRDHARSPIGRGGDDLAASGVFFVHRHGVKRHPVVDRMRRGHVQPAFGDQRVMDALGPAAHLEAAGQDARPLHPARNAVVHHLPEAGDAGVDFGGGAVAQLVLALHLRDAQARGMGHLQHLGCRLEWEGHVGAGAGFGAARLGQLARGQHEAAADGVVGFLQDHVALGVGGLQDHAIGVSRQGGAEVELQVLQRVEVEGGQARNLDDFRVADAGEGGIGLVGIVSVGGETGEAEDRGPVGGMADPGKGQRAVERGAEAVEVEGRGAQRVQKACGGDHRAHGVGRGRADADLEHVEDGKEHQTLGLVKGVGPRPSASATRRAAGRDSCAARTACKCGKAARSIL